MFTFRYIDSIKPCVTPVQYVVTQDLVKEFAIGCGQKYTERLLENVKNESEWHKTALPNYTFLFSRQEQVLQNSSTVVQLMDDLWPAKPNSMIERASELIQLTTEFLVLLCYEEIVPLRNENNETQCMHPFRKLFSSCRIPGIPQDGIASYFKTDTEEGVTPKHVIVIYKSNIFSVEVMYDDKKTLGKHIIRQSLRRIIRYVDQSLDGMCAGVGVLTSMDRNSWAVNREKLMLLSEDNAKYMLLIEQAICVISLDHCSARPSHIYHEAVFADGCNRWFDKGLSFYVYANGLVTANVNNSLQERWPLAVLLDYIHLRVLEDAEKWDDTVALSVSKCLQHKPISGKSDIFEQIRAIFSPVSNSVSPNDSEGVLTEKDDDADEFDLREIPFKVDVQLTDLIEKTKNKFDVISQSMSTAACDYFMFEKGLLQRLHVHPDTFAHLVIQLTFYRMYFRMPSMGTRVPSSSFHHGRYEIMRPVTLESFEWCKLMMSDDTDQSTKVNAFWKAEKKHRSIFNHATNGRGIQNHMAALKLIGDQIDNALPGMFRDEAYAVSGGSGRFQIYVESLGGFRNNFISKPVVLPTNTDGYGVGYAIDSGNTKICFCVTSWKDDPTTCAHLFASSLRSTMEIHHNFFLGLS